MNGRQWTPTTTSREARVQIRSWLSLRGAWRRWAGPCALSTVLLLSLTVGSGCASGGAAAAEPAIDVATSLAGADVLLARHVVDRTAGSEARSSVELELQRPDGSRETVTRVVQWTGADDQNSWLPLGVGVEDRALISVRTEAAVWRSPIAIPLGSIDPRHFAAEWQGATRPGADGAAEFARFCERLTLHRDPMGGAPAPGGIARAWFGDLVAATGDESPRIVLTLADATVALFEREDEAQARALVEGGWHVPSAAAAWSTARWLGLHDLIGAEAFRGALRRLVDTHGGGAAIGVEQVVDAFESEEARAFVRTWFRGPAHARVETSWRHDEERSRILLRVDQAQEIERDALAAYSFTLPIVIVLEKGGRVERKLTVERRRELFEIMFEGVPAGVKLDPDATLAGRVEFLSASGREASSGDS